MKRLLSGVYRYFFPLPLVEMYRRMGVEIGKGTKIQFGVIIDYSHYWHISIGDNVTIAPNVHILAHDASMHNTFGYAKIGKVEIGNESFIGAGSIILPGVTIGKNSIVGAGSVVTRDVPENMVCAGNPAKEICSISVYNNRIKEELSKFPNFDETYTLGGGVSESMKKEMNEKMKSRFAYIK